MNKIFTAITESLAEITEFERGLLFGIVLILMANYAKDEAEA